MKLICYALHREPPAMRPAPATRPWMDATPQSFAYRCLPLNIANAHGWELLTGAAFTAVWDGGGGKEAIRITADGPAHHVPISHFGSGVLTFHVHGLFRTEPGVELWVTGSPNSFKHGLAPLSGLIETDWAPYTFTMNWRFTAPGVEVSFGVGEPFCFLFPLRREALSAAEPEIRPISDDPELERQYRDWSQGRLTFNDELSRAGSLAQRQRWQRGYFRGERPDGERGSAHHRTKLRLPPFRRAERG